MAGGDVNPAQRIRALLGQEAVLDREGGVPRAAPATEEELATLLATASAAGWHARIEGRGTWMPPDAPSDFGVTTRRMSSIGYLNPADLVVTVGAGMAWSELRRILADEGTWIVLDPPGGDRSVGSVVATATAGPLRGGYGSVRDHLLGVTLVSGDGRIVRAGGRVVKNVAGFDLGKLAVGSFGVFGVITSATFRLRAVPRADVALVTRGPRDVLLAAARRILAHGMTPPALELTTDPASGSGDWMLALRLLGGGADVAAQRDSARGIADLTFTDLSAAEGADWWRTAQERPLREPVTVRLGTLPASLESVLDLVAHFLGEGAVSTSVAAGQVRWSGAAAPDDVRRLRHAAAQQETPLTLERAPWAIRAAIGHFGAYREGVGRLVGGLRRTFDPAGTLVTGVGTEA